MTIADDFAEAALTLIAQFGVDASFAYAPIPGTWNQGTGQRDPASTPTPWEGKAFPEDKGLWLGKELGVIGEKRLFIAGDAITRKPKPGDKFTVAGETFSVIDKGVKEYGVLGRVALYEVYGQRGG